MVNPNDIIPGEPPRHIKRRIGLKFGKVTLIRYMGYIPKATKTKGEKWRDRFIEIACDCGKKAIKRFSVRMPKSCGCLSASIREKKKGLIGKTINGRKVLCIEKQAGYYVYKVKCKCGAISYISKVKIFINRCVHCGKTTKLTKKEELEIYEVYKSKIYNRKQLCIMFNVSENYVKGLLYKLNKRYKNDKS